jgi:nicotinate-nucleotide adenylyltransferase
MALSVAWPEVTAYFGGTFDPPHLGHVEAARGLLQYPRVKEVRIVPSQGGVQKRPQATASQRKKMVELAIQPLIQGGLPVTVDSIEIDTVSSQEPHAGTTWNTLQKIQLPRHLRAWVIGTDQLHNLTTWHRFPEVLGQCHWIVLQRQGVPTDLPPWLNSQLRSLGPTDSGVAYEIPSSLSPRGLETARPLYLQIVSTEAPAVSSQALRAAWALGKTELNSQVSAPILDYLKEHHLYGN